MPRKKPMHVYKETGRGKEFWYYREGKGKRFRLKCKPWSDEWHQEIKDAANGIATNHPKTATQGSVRWLIDQYHSSSAWAAYNAATRAKNDRFYQRMIDVAGDYAFTSISKALIRSGMDQRRATPSQANNWLKAMRNLFAWAAEYDYLKTNPCDGVKSITVKTDGFYTWTDDDMDAFRTHWPIGTRERLAFELLRATGLRRGDLCTLGVQHIKQGAFILKPKKTANSSGLEVFLPIPPELWEAIDATERNGLCLIESNHGAPYSPEGFSNWFRKAARAANVQGSPHGIRKNEACKTLESGASVAELMARMGWERIETAHTYIRKIDRTELGKKAANKRFGTNSKPLTTDLVRETTRKSEQNQ